jgi:hypothetical protein
MNWTYPSDNESQILVLDVKEGTKYESLLDFLSLVLTESKYLTVVSKCRR